MSVISIGNNFTKSSISPPTKHDSTIGHLKKRPNSSNKVVNDRQYQSLNEPSSILKSPIFLMIDSMVSDPDAVLATCYAMSLKYGLITSKSKENTVL